MRYLSFDIADRLFDVVVVDGQIVVRRILLLLLLLAIAFSAAVFADRGEVNGFVVFFGLSGFLISSEYAAQHLPSFKERKLGLLRWE